jgi:hypothetical protein
MEDGWRESSGMRSVAHEEQAQPVTSAFWRNERVADEHSWSGSATQFDRPPIVASLVDR